MKIFYEKPTNKSDSLQRPEGRGFSPTLLIEYNGFRGHKNGQVFGHTQEKDKAKTELYNQNGLWVINIYKGDLKNPDKAIRKVNKEMQKLEELLNPKIIKKELVSV